MKAKKYLVVVLSTVMIMACGGHKQKAEVDDNYESEPDVETTDVNSDKSVVEVEESTFPENVRIYTGRERNDYSNLSFDDFIMTLTDDGRAEVIGTITQYEAYDRGEPKKFPVKRDGTWVARTVKRGARTLNAYDVRIGDNNYYLTEKFDLIWGMEAGDGKDPYHDFMEGMLEGTWKIKKYEIIK